MRPSIISAAPGFLGAIAAGAVVGAGVYFLGGPGWAVFQSALLMYVSTLILAS